MTNTLAYFDMELIRTVKGLVIQVTGVGLTLALPCAHKITVHLSTSDKDTSLLRKNVKLQQEHFMILSPVS
jgi:hypothetical protein